MKPRINQLVYPITEFSLLVLQNFKFNCIFVY